MGIKLTKSEIEQYEKAFDDLYFHSVSDALSHYYGIFENISLPIKNPDFADCTKEEFFKYLSLRRHYHLLCLGYHISLEQNNPKLLLNSFYTYNYLNSMHQLESGTDHSIFLKDVILCYAGNNIDLVDSYFPIGSELSSNGHRFNVTGTNLILAIRDPDLRNEAMRQVKSYLDKKNPQFDTSIILTLYGILIQDNELITENINLVIKNHKKSSWLHSFNNDIGKFLPFIAYGLYAIAYKFLDRNIFDQIILNNNRILWEEFINLNKINNFEEGEKLIEFDGNLKFINH